MAALINLVRKISLRQIQTTLRNNNSYDNLRLMQRRIVVRELLKDMTSTKCPKA